jgi:hypothetical protein
LAAFVLKRVAKEIAMKRTANTAIAALVVAGILSTTAARARADVASGEQAAVPLVPVSSSTQAPPPAQSQWYGWQILGIDAATVFAAGAAPNAVAPVAPYILLGSGPAVHLAHGHPGRALGSALLRAGLPAAGLFIGAASANCSQSNIDDDDLCGLGEAIVGGLVGVASAEIIDAGFLAWDDDGDSASSSSEESPHEKPVILPSVSVTPQSASAGLLMTF